MKRILILNNHEETMSLLQQYLKKHSYDAEYMYRAEGDNVIEKVKDYSPDLILLESSIGEEGPLCQRIKENGDNIPVIILGGNIATTKEQENCGVNEIISKPFEPKILLQRIEKLLKTG